MNVTTQSQQQTESQQQSDTNLNVANTLKRSNSNSNSISSPVNGIIEQKKQQQQQQQNSSVMNPTTNQQLARSPSPDGSSDYDVTRMREEDFERLAVYIVPDVQCERGIANRADKTLPRSLTLKPSLVFLSPNVKVSLSADTY